MPRNEKQEGRLKELTALQQMLRGNAELEYTHIRKEVEAYQQGQMRILTDKVKPVEMEYKKAMENVESEKKRATKEVQRKFVDSRTAVRRVKKEALAAIEVMVGALHNEVQSRINAADLKVRKLLYAKLGSLEQEKAALEKAKK